MSRQQHRGYHPLVDELRRKFGLDAKKRYVEENVDDMFFSLRHVGGDDLIWATTQEAAVSEFGRQMCISAICVAAINDVPIYEAMQVEGVANFPISDVKYPPKAIRFAAASRFLQFCLSEPGMESILLGVNQLYSVHFDLANRHSIPTLDGEKVVFQCPNDNFNSELVPRVDPKTKEVLPYHCMLCGSELMATRKFEAGENPFAQPKTTPTSPSGDTSSPKPE